MKKTIAGAALLITTPAFAHVSADHADHFTAGFLHPFSGLDHMLAMIAVGLCAAMLGGAARGTLPLTFLTAMLAGFGIGATGAFSIPAYEAMIVASVIGFGLVLAVGRMFPIAVVLIATALFGSAHGFAHGIEGVFNASYASGFLAATAVLHCLGLAAGFFSGRMKMPMIYKLSGGALTLTGLALAFA